MSERPAQTSELRFEELYKRLDEAESSLTRDVDASPEQRKAILSSRAKALAGERVREQAEKISLLSFKGGGERYAVTIDEVDEVLEIKGLSPLLGTPRQVLGALVARSRVVPVLDLRLLLGLEGGGMSDLTKVVVVGKSEDLFGLAVEEIEGKLELPKAGWVRPGTGPFQHVTADRLAVLDLSMLGEPGAVAQQVNG